MEVDVDGRSPAGAAGASEPQSRKGRKGIWVEQSAPQNDASNALTESSDIEGNEQREGES